MNLFYLDRSPQSCAAQHCDSHVIKMIIEYAQLLSTAHRILDGKESVELVNGRRLKRWTLPFGDNDYYLASHVNHPDAVWCRTSSENYKFLYRLFVALCDEYTHRYGKTHATETKCKLPLGKLPDNIPTGPFTDPPLTMPDEYKVDDAVVSYQNLYVGSKSRFAKWTNRKPPEWFIQRIPNYNETDFERTR